ncbi:MAG: thermonuclease family protein [Candidatus Omnitrophica bacterium]|nr:thermonuclease family protein [Candidatus Omnitrophota bacterium]
MKKKADRSIERYKLTNKLFIICLVISLTFCGCSGEVGGRGEAKIGIPWGKSYSYDNILVIRVVDGDTLVLENGQRLRLIGIDTPEIHESTKLYKDSQRSGKDIRTIKQLGQKSFAFTRQLVEGKRVRLEFDIEKTDRYGRLLAYVFLPDGTFVNAEIIKQGYANLLTYPPNVKYVDLFRQLYKEARESKRGLWAEE